VGELGPGYGYFPYPVKTCLLVNPIAYRSVRQLFAGTNVEVCVEGK